MYMNLELGVSRFKNIDGVSCYIVSILHILQQIPFFRKFIKYTKYAKLIENKITNTNEINNFIIYELGKIIFLSINNNNIEILPLDFKKLLGKKNSMWAEIEHQDSQEFYSYIISKIEEECGQHIKYIPNINFVLNINNISKNNYNILEKQMKPKGELVSLKYEANLNILQILALNYIQRSEIKDYSSIKNFFIGYLISNTKCYFCSTNSPCFESFITLPLSIPINKNTNIKFKYKLEDCLYNMTKNEKLDKYNKLTCDICGIKNQSIKKVQIWKAPQILVIQLKRFVTNAFGVQTAKILNPVIYPVNDFNIIEYFHPDSPYKQNTIYNLIGINIHKEIGFGSLNAGHYISIVKNIHNNKWYLFDDSKKVEELDNIQNKNAYLLFYCKY